MRLFVFAVLTLTAQPPIVFVHGNGDDAAKWMSILWLFESNGYPREKLRAVRFTNPSARLNDAKFEAHRSSTTDQAAELSAAVTRMLIDTKFPKVALIGSSRGGNTIRNYIKNGGGAAVVSHAILAGTPNHGVFITGANTNNEWYAQPNGVGYDSPMLKGAENVVLPALDHREVAFRPEAFRVMYRFLTGSEPATLKVIGEFHPRIGGLVTGFAGGTATNLPEPGVRLRIFAVNGQTGQREGPAITSADGVWGPLEVQGDRNFEFELEKNESSIRYFRSPFPRSSEIVNVRFRPVAAANTLAARPQGYWAKDRDLLTFNGEPVVNVPSGLPTSDTIPLHVTTGGVLELRGERIAIRPAKTVNKELHIADFNWD